MTKEKTANPSKALSVEDTSCNIPENSAPKHNAGKDVSCQRRKPARPRPQKRRRCTSSHTVDMADSPPLLVKAINAMRIFMRIAVVMIFVVTKAIISMIAQVQSIAKQNVDVETALSKHIRASDLANKAEKKADRIAVKLRRAKQKAKKATGSNANNAKSACKKQKSPRDRAKELRAKALTLRKLVKESKTNVSQILTDYEYPTQLSFRATLNGTDAYMYNGDAYSSMECMEPHQFDIILTDPPYNVLDRKSAEFDKVLLDMKRMAKGFRRVLKQDGVVIVFCGSNQISDLEQILHDVGFDHVTEGGWFKLNPEQGKNTLTKAHESYLIACNKENKLLTCGRHTPWNFVLAPIVHKAEQVQKDNSGKNNNALHDTQKGLGAIIRLLQTQTNGGRLLDPFAGTFTISRAALLSGIDSVAIEKDKTYFERSTLAFSDERIMRACHTRMHDWGVPLGDIIVAGFEKTFEKLEGLTDDEREELVIDFMMTTGIPSLYRI